MFRPKRPCGTLRFPDRSRPTQTVKTEGDKTTGSLKTTPIWLSFILERISAKRYGYYNTRDARRPACDIGRSEKRSRRLKNCENVVFGAESKRERRATVSANAGVLSSTRSGGSIYESSHTGSRRRPSHPTSKERPSRPLLMRLGNQCASCPNRLAPGTVGSPLDVRAS